MRQNNRQASEKARFFRDPQLPREVQIVSEQLLLRGFGLSGLILNPFAQISADDFQLVWFINIHGDFSIGANQGAPC